MATPGSDQRRFARLRVSPMYTPVAVRLPEDDGFLWDGHAYDVSEGGAQFELDRDIEPGTTVAIRLTFPPVQGESDEGRDVIAVGNIIWSDDDEVAGPVRLAVAFTAFPRPGDRERLLWRLATQAVAKRRAA